MTTTDWRGRAVTNDDDDLPIDESVSRRREARSLLGSLLRPYVTTVALLAIVVVAENAARLSVPLLVQRGIDHGIPPIVEGHSCARTADDRRGAVRRRADTGHQPDVLPAPLRTDRPEGATRVAPQAVSALPAARRRLPRPLHLRPGGRPLDQ